MSTLNLPQIEFLCQELGQAIIGCKVSYCSPNDPKRFYLHLDRHCLFFCFQRPLMRFHLTSKVKKTTSLHPLNAYLTDMTLRSIKTLNRDRIVQFEFSKDSKQLFLICEFFSKHPNYYLTDTEKKILFALHPTNQDYYAPPQENKIPHIIPNELLSSKQMEEHYAELEFQQTKHSLNATLHASLKGLQKQKSALEKSLMECENWHDMQHEGDLLKANLSSFKKGIHKVDIWDWVTNQYRSLQIDAKRSPQEEMALRFKKAKKLQKGIVPLKDQLQKILDQIQSMENNLLRLEKTQTIEELAGFDLQTKKTQGPPKQKIKKAALPYYEFQSQSGLRILVGKNAKANDKLTFQVANGNDWWLHVMGMPGSHVVIKTHKDQKPDSDTLQDAMQLALHYSKAKNQGEGEICLTQRKFVSRLNQPGKVQVSQRQIFWERLNHERLKMIKARQITPHP